MVDAANKEKYSSRKRIAIAERASLEDVYRPHPHIFHSREDGGGIRDIGKHDFRLVLVGAVIYC